MNNKICIPVTGNTINKFLSNLAVAQKMSNFVELRIDLINNISQKDLELIKNKIKKKAILTCRTQKEGGSFKKSEKERIDIIEQALKLGFDYVDIELSAITSVNLKNKAKKTKIICSYHDFKKTPSYKKLEEIANIIQKNKNCDVGKIVTMVKTQTDIQKLLRLLLNKDEKVNMIVLGMGKIGKITRILSPILGGYLTFASIGKKQSAPGQLDIKELEKIYKTIS